MSIIGGQNTPTTNGLAYIIDFNNNYISGSSTVTPILYLPTASQFTGSVPNLVNGQVQFTGSSVLRSFQTFPGFSATQGNMTLMFSGESKNSNVLFTQDGTVAVVSTTSSIGYGVPAGNLGRNFPNVGFDHVTLRFSSSSVDCFVNGIPVSASGIFPTVPSSSTFNDFKIGGNYLTSWTGSFSGSLGQLMVYNRVLSDDEIYSNYLIQARRYGLPEIPKPYTVDSSVYVYTQAAGITGSSTISALNTFVSGLKSAGLWDKMIAIYPFIGTSPSASRLNLKDVSLNTTQVNYSGSWSTSLSGSYNTNTSSYGILSNITPTYSHPLINSQSLHMSYLSYDTPTTGGFAMGTGIGLGANGGIISYANGRVYHIFTSGSSSFIPTHPSLTSVEVLVVAGGGGGGSIGTGGGGGGAGGLVYSSSFSVTPLTSYTTVIGNPGTGSAGTSGSNGENSQFSTIIALGGGGGAGSSDITGVSGSSGGSGGGGAGRGSLGVIGIGGLGTSGQGNNGGNGTAGSDGGGGGGGAGTSGSNATNSGGGSGGSGSFFPQFVSIGYGFPAGWFAGGGGGGTGGSSGGLAGIGGGGVGGVSAIPAGTTGSTNTGGGGGGSRGGLTAGSSGGSGIIIISYPIIPTAGTSSATIYFTPLEVSSSLNSNVQGVLTTGGPVGLITVSRTGSSNFKLWKNRVPTTITARASASLSNNIYLNSINIGESSISASQNTVAYASVGAGLTDSEVYTYYELVDNLQTNLGRSKSTNPNAFITTWDTRISGTGTVSNTSSIVLPLFGTQAITASWGDGTVSLISSSTQVDRTHSYATPGVYTVSITGQGQGFQFNNGGDRNKLMDVGQWGSISGSTTAAFYGCNNLVGTTPDSLTIQTTDLTSTFQSAIRFNGYLNNWRPISCSSFLSMFNGASAFNQPVGNWPLSASNIDMRNMFQSANSFNQDLGSWDVSRVTTMGNMFVNNNAFNNSGLASINNWRPISCSAFNGMFQATTFNQPIGNWPISASSITMGSMFQQASLFNQNIGTWDVSKVTNMSYMFSQATAFNNSGSNSINNWRPISCSNFDTMFYQCPFNQPIGNWPLSASSIYMGNMFLSATAFNQNIGSWDVSKVTGMTSMFQSATTFNNSGSNTINNWRPISCSAFNSMFQSATAFNQPIGNWPISASNVNMFRMFYAANAFNQNIGSWDVSKVTNMSGMFLSTAGFNNSGSNSINNWRPISCSNFSAMFQSATSFNQPIGNWPLSGSNIDMNSMFEGANSFNQDISTWDTSRVTVMNRMFYSATSFQQNLGSWDVSKTTTLNAMFTLSNFNNSGSPDINNWRPVVCSDFAAMFRQSPFNQPIGNWTLSTGSNVNIDMTSMFNANFAFDQDISTWNVSRVTNLSNFMLNKTSYSYLTNIYSDTGWIRTEVRPNVVANFGSIKYSGSAAQGRALLTRAYNTGSITAYSSDGPNLALTCSFNHNVVAGNKVFISGSSDPSINGVQTVQATSSATMLTLALPISPPAVTGDRLFTGYGWSITDGGVV